MAKLTLALKGEYFDAIRAGTKLEEFRLVTPYWRKRLEGRHYDFIELTRGYPRRGDHAGACSCRGKASGWQPSRTRTSGLSPLWSSRSTFSSRPSRMTPPMRCFHRQAGLLAEIGRT